MKERCEWAEGNPLLMSYHDTEWGVPVHDDQRLFESLILQGAQAGLNWLTILKKRGNYREAFDGFDPILVAKYDEGKIQDLLGNSGIIRNRLKISAAVANAKLFLKIKDQFGTFDKYIWQFVDGKTIQNRWKSMSELPPKSPESEAMSRDLKRRGFSFVGPTICYAFMQALGMVNDHSVNCFRHRELQNMVTC